MPDSMTPVALIQDPVGPGSMVPPACLDEVADGADSATGPAVASDPGCALASNDVLVLLRALARMARASRRHEADVQSAMRGAGVRLESQQRDAALRRLLETECIERVVPLSDGGILLSVTALGMGRAGQPGRADQY